MRVAAMTVADSAGIMVLFGFFIVLKKKDKEKQFTIFVTIPYQFVRTEFFFRDNLLGRLPGYRSWWPIF